LIHSPGATPDAHSAAALEVQGLSKRFASAAAPVWSGVSFSVPVGQRVAIVGGNGTGKSTLLRCCVRAIEPDAGTVAVAGQPLLGLERVGLRQVRSRVGFVFQKHHLVTRLSVLSNVLHGALGTHGSARLWFQGLAPAPLRHQALACLEQVGLAGLASRRADELSGGQSQRVAIARALMQEPALLLADEPAASLDPQAGDEVMQLFSELARLRGLTLVFVTHHLEHALACADRVLGLRDGALVLDMTTRDVDVSRLRALYEQPR
jgi:phosphonate transport system ATP-binding protein